MYLLSAVVNIATCGQNTAIERQTFVKYSHFSVNSVAKMPHDISLQYDRVLVITILHMLAT